MGPESHKGCRHLPISARRLVETINNAADTNVVQPLQKVALNEARVQLANEHLERVAGCHADSRRKEEEEEEVQVADA